MIDRRRFLSDLVFGAVGLSIAGCAAPPTPAPTVAPAKTAVPPTAAPAAPPTPAPKPTAVEKPPAPAAAKTAPPAKTMTSAELAYPTPSVTAAVFYIAKEKGYLREEGIDLDLQQVPSANAVKAMLAGEIRFFSGVGTAVTSTINGAPLKVIFLSTHGPIAWLYARSEIKSIADLRGKSIAITAPGDSSDNLARAALATAKLNPETDASYVSVPGASRNRFQAVVSGSVDASIIFAPENLIADQQGLTRLLFLSDRVMLSTDGAVTTDVMIKEKPDIVRGFVRASIKSLQFLKSNKAGAVPLWASFMTIERDQASTLYDSVVGGFTDNGIEGDDVLKSTIDDQRRISQVTQPIAVNQVFDLSFAKQTGQELKTSGWKPQ